MVLDSVTTGPSRGQVINNKENHFFLVMDPLVQEVIEYEVHHN